MNSEYTKYTKKTDFGHADVEAVMTSEDNPEIADLDFDQVANNVENKITNRHKEALQQNTRLVIRVEKTQDADAGEKRSTLDRLTAVGKKISEFTKTTLEALKNIATGGGGKNEMSEGERTKLYEVLDMFAGAMEKRGNEDMDAVLTDQESTKARRLVEAIRAIATPRELMNLRDRLMADENNKEASQARIESLGTAAAMVEKMNLLEKTSEKERRMERAKDTSHAMEIAKTLEKAITERLNASQIPEKYTSVFKERLQEMMDAVKDAPTTAKKEAIIVKRIYPLEQKIKSSLVAIVSDRAATIDNFVHEKPWAAEFRYALMKFNDEFYLGNKLARGSDAREKIDWLLNAAEKCRMLDSKRGLGVDDSTLTMIDDELQAILADVEKFSGGSIPREHAETNQKVAETVKDVDDLLRTLNRILLKNNIPESSWKDYLSQDHDASRLVSLISGLITPNELKELMPDSPNDRTIELVTTVANMIKELNLRGNKVKQRKNKNASL